MNPNINIIETQLIELVKQLLIESDELHHRDIHLNASLQRHLGIDSLAKAELFQRVEKKFKVSIPDKLLTEVDTLEDLAQFIVNAQPGEKYKPKEKIILSHSEKVQLELSSVHSLVDVLLLYGEKHPEKIHIYFQHEDGREEPITYGQLLANAKRFAKGLQDRGIFDGDCVAIMLPTTPEFFYAFYGTLFAGAVPVPIYPPFRANKLDAYAKTEAKILNSAEVRLLITFKEASMLSKLLQSFVPSLKHVVTAADLLKLDESEIIFHPRGKGAGLIQYTSGSTSDPKGVLLTHANLLANIRGYGKAIQVNTDDVVVSWLPLYHDLGLIGMWLGSLYHGLPLVLMTPFSFLNRPERWLWMMHSYQATISGAPNFAYELCIRKFDASLYEGLDLSKWRIAANGAEKVYPKTLEQFSKIFAPYGFKKNTLFPVYGLAENCVGLTIPTPGEPYRIDRVIRSVFEESDKAVATQDKNALEFVGCGKPIEDHEVRIVDAAGNVLDERCVGSLQFRGPSGMQGYYNNPEATKAIMHNGWIDSGDLAYIADGDIFITGRRKDLIVKAGRNLYPVEIEECIKFVSGIRQGCTVAFSVTDENRATERLIVVAETRVEDAHEREKIAERISEAIATTLDIVPDQVIMVAPHVVPKTSSGKLQRSACKKMYLEGKLKKSDLSTWMQLVKLGLQGAGRELVYWAGNIAKVLYTTYFLLLFGIILIPCYFSALFCTRDTAANVCKKMNRMLLFLAFCRVRIKHVGDNKQYPKSVIYAANHASYLDALVMLSILPTNTLFVGKKELLNTIVLRTFMKKLQFLPVDRFDSAKGVEDTDVILKALRDGYSVMIFPEGTFGYGVGLRPFRLGAFKLAVDAGISICPIALKGTRMIWRGEEKLIKPGLIDVTMMDAISPNGAEWADVIKLRHSVREMIAQYCGETPLDLINSKVNVDT